MDKPPQKEWLGKGFTLAIGLFCATLALFLFLQSPFFAVQTVELTGNLYLRQADVLSIAGVEATENLFDINVRQATARLQAHPQVEAASVRRRLPSTLVVRIVEREPAAVIATSDRFAAVDRNGRVLVVTQSPRHALPLITGLQIDQVTPGEALAVSGLSQALHVADRLGSDLGTRVSEISWQRGNISLIMRNLLTIELGDVEHLTEKLTTLRALLRELDASTRPVRTIDLRVPTSPVLR